MSWTVLFGMILGSLPSSAMESPEPAVVTYGNAAVEHIHSIEGNYAFLCDISDFPPVIGLKIPVFLRGLESPPESANPALRLFLEEILLNHPGDPNSPRILLKDLQRGPAFCLIADIEVDGADLGSLLVEKGLVKRIFRVPGEPEAAPIIEPAVHVPSKTPQVKPAVAESSSGHFVASKTGKVFHRSDCYHVKRITEDKNVTFSSKQAAEASGRRPCKTCNP
jgi:hypothetical protein